MQTWNPQAHLATCREGCTVRHCGCGAPARYGRWTCGRFDVCVSARNENKIRRFLHLPRKAKRS